MQGLSLSGVGWVTGEEDKGNYSDGISVTRDESEDDDFGQCIWCEGLSCLSRLSNHTHAIDPINQKDQIDQMN